MSARAEARADVLSATDRDDARAKRMTAAAGGMSDEAAASDAPPTRLARVFADIADSFTTPTVRDVLSRSPRPQITIAGCRMASVTLVERSGYRTAASTDRAATAVDQAQYQLDEGPCLGAVDPQWLRAVVSDERWPTLASRPIESRLQSALSYRLAAASIATADSGGGSRTPTASFTCVHRHCARPAEALWRSWWRLVQRREVSEWAGHNSVAFTLTRYGCLFDDGSKTAVDRLDALLEAARRLDNVLQLDTRKLR